MDDCEVLVIGGGPAGSTCAWKLKQAGLDVLLMDKALFPRQKTCAGWITPAVLETLAVDAEHYRRGRVLQEISAFRVGLMDGSDQVIRYGATVSFGILRSEFDHFLLQRAAVRLQLGEAVASLERKGGWWMVNRRIRARLVVGAGGHFCPAARLLGGAAGRETLVVAQAAEVALDPQQERLCSLATDTPALFFCRDMRGYGWLFRKGRYLNIGLGRTDTRDLAGQAGEFRAFLVRRGYLPPDVAVNLRGHAYRLYGRQGRNSWLGDGVLLIGDAAGLAQPQSGEGILPAVESALVAADAILSAKGDYRRDNLEPYAARLAGRFDDGCRELPASPLLSDIARRIGARLLSSKRFVRHVVLDRWFLHAHHPARR